MTIEQEISKQVITTGYLWEVYFDDGKPPRRYSDWGDTSFIYDGNEYFPAYIKCSDITEKADSSTNSIMLSIGNLDREVQRFIEDHDLIGKTVKQIQWFNNTNNVRTYVWKIAQVTAREDVATFTLNTNIDFLKVKLPNRTMHGRFCNWQFKDASCKYDGPDAICEKTWDDCQEKKNTLNFGGAPGILTTHFYF